MRTLIHPLAVFGITIVAYVLTMPRTITLEDAGLFQMVCHLGGVAHPPGYPLFTALCGVLVQVPGVMNGNLVSALFGALASALLYLVVVREAGERVPAYVAALGWGLCTTFWSQAIIIEVYTLAALMFVICWALLAEFVRTREAKWWWASCLAFGLSISNHWPIAILAAPALAIAALPALDTFLSNLRSARFILLSIVLFLVGLSPYSLLFAEDPVVAVFGGIESLDELGRYVSRSMYSDHHPAAGSMDRLYYAGWVIGQSLLQPGPVLSPLILLGLVASFRVLPRSLAISLLALWLGGTLALVMLLNFQFTHYYRAVFRPYPIVAYAAIAVWMAIGAGIVMRRLRSFWARADWIVMIVVCVSVLVWNYPRVDRRHAVLVDHFARTVLESLPANAVLFTRGDNYTGPIGYLHHVEGVRPDVELRDWENLVFSNRLASPLLPKEEQEARISAFIESAEVPVFLMEPRISPRVHYGAYFEYDPTGDGYGFRPELEALADLLVQIDRQELLLDAHEAHFVFDLLIQYARQYVRYSLEMPGRVSGKRRERVMLIQSTFAGKLATLELLVPRGRHEKDYLLEIVRQAEAQVPDEITNEAIAVFNELTGRIHRMPPEDLGAAEVYLRRSVEAWPLGENRSICPLIEVLLARGKPQAAIALDQRFPGAECAEPAKPES